jgi:hypothetical protein
VDSSKLNDWMQVIGIFAVVASLIFVGLQMRQAQEISMSDAYQVRAAAAVEWTSAFAANAAALSAYRKATEGGVDTITPEEHDALRYTMLGVFYLFDNAHYQYQSGFLSDEFWVMIQQNIKTYMANPVARKLFLEKTERGVRPGFRDVLLEIDAELESELGE